MEAREEISGDYIQCVEVTPLENESEIVYEEDFTKLVKLETDMIIISIGQGPQGAVVSESSVIKTGKGLLDVDTNGMTNIPEVYEAGDIGTGPKTVDIAKKKGSTCVPKQEYGELDGEEFEQTKAYRIQICACGR